MDEIAFQINLFALNAGIEAARAGQVGKGFALVAQEVRELAHRSSQAAKEVASLIGNSAAEVADGSGLVSETGRTLMEISGYIAEIAGQIDAIARSGTEQAAAISDVNTAMARLDRLTQSNAAMAEETEAATAKLSEEAGRMMELVGRFERDADRSAPADISNPNAA